MAGLGKSCLATLKPRYESPLCESIICATDRRTDISVILEPREHGYGLGGLPVTAMHAEAL